MIRKKPRTNWYKIKNHLQIGRFSTTTHWGLCHQYGHPDELWTCLAAATTNGLCSTNSSQLLCATRHGFSQTTTVLPLLFTKWDLSKFCWQRIAIQPNSSWNQILQKWKMQRQQPTWVQQPQDRPTDACKCSSSVTEKGTWEKEKFVCTCISKWYI